MAKSKIIKELVNEEISLGVALKRLVVLASDLGDDELKNWAQKEIVGYDDEDAVPNYRCLESFNFTYSGINGAYKVTNQALALSFISEDILKELNPNKIREPIVAIEQKSHLNDGQICIDRSFLSGDVFKNSKEGFFGIQCVSINQNFTATQFREIVETVSSKVLDILLKLDSEFGCLDSLDIGSEKSSQNKIDEVKQDINVIIFGDKNKIKDSSMIADALKINNKKIKNNKSNTGKGNNNITTENKFDTEVNVNSTKK